MLVLAAGLCIETMLQNISNFLIWVDTVAYRMSPLNTTLAVQIYTLDIDTHGGMFTIFKYQILFCAQEE